MSTIDARTTVCALFGHPVGHSLSPELHNAGFSACELPFVYVAHDVPSESLPAAFAAIRTLGYRGLSVTIPHKVAALSLVDEVDTTAKRIGCINTVVREGERLVGYNSDGRGALGALRRAGRDPAGAHVVILGSGGAARAVAMTLALEAAPQKLTIAAVDEAEREQLAADVQAASGSSVLRTTTSPEALKPVLAEADLLLHCTPIGMHPHSSTSLVPSELLHPGVTVFDAVYNPRRTLLLKQAAERGCQVVEGLEMFLGQALVQFELWTGHSPPIDIMRRVLEEKL